MIKIKNIIFDLGGVILNIDFQKIYNAFEMLGAKNLDLVHTTTSQHELIDQFEMGQISSAQFRESMNKTLELQISDEEFDRAWNAILLDIPSDRIECIRRLKKQYSLSTFLLSNTNEIHLNTLRNQHGPDLFKDCFDKEYYSHLLGNRKPNPEVFLHILRENNLSGNETLFLDDYSQNIDAALSVGIHAQLIHSKFSILEIEKNYFVRLK